MKKLIGLLNLVNIVCFNPSRYSPDMLEYLEELYNEINNDEYKASVHKDLMKLILKNFKVSDRYIDLGVDILYNGKHHDLINKFYFITLFEHVGFIISIVKKHGLSNLPKYLKSAGPVRVGSDLKKLIKFKLPSLKPLETYLNDKKVYYTFGV